MDVQKVSNEYRLNYWAEIIKECRNSGQTVSSWCEEHGINVKSYYYWLRKVRIAACNSIPGISKKHQESIVPIKADNEVQPAFAEIKVPAIEATQPAIILKLNYAVIEIQNSATNSIIENTLKALKSIC
jgi:transposase-like protein